ncbi:hypothetical protein F2Q68_00028162 [Brassica cretica]|uniref:Uncharacterized protein n=1 Tax=Brassica cretica TaxID=69181 RepID=A0A8S9IJL8_BRACR|nr:hypothetical protein F2Q68_00028162 [Brassica cretica]
MRNLIQQPIESGAEQKLRHARGQRPEARVGAVVVVHLESGSVWGCGGVGSAEDDYRIGRAVGAATSEGRVGGGEREARGASSVEGVGRGEIGGLLDVFEEASVAVGAGDGGGGGGGGGDPDEAVAAVAPVRSRSHGDREEGNVESNRGGEGEGEDEGNGGGLSLTRRRQNWLTPNRPIRLLVLSLV